MAQQRWRAVTIAIALGAASPAAADALQYQAPEVPEGCPDELVFRQAPLLWMQTPATRWICLSRQSCAARSMAACDPG